MERRAAWAQGGMRSPLEVTLPALTALRVRCAHLFSGISRRRMREGSGASWDQTESEGSLKNTKRKAQNHQKLEKKENEKKHKGEKPAVSGGMHCTRRRATLCVSIPLLAAATTSAPFSCAKRGLCVAFLLALSACDQTRGGASRLDGALCSSSAASAHCYPLAYIARRLSAASAARVELSA